MVVRVWSVVCMNVITLFTSFTITILAVKRATFQPRPPSLHDKTTATSHACKSAAAKLMFVLLIVSSHSAVANK